MIHFERDPQELGQRVDAVEDRFHELDRELPTEYGVLPREQQLANSERVADFLEERQRAWVDVSAHLTDVEAQLPGRFFQGRRRYRKDYLEPASDLAGRLR